MKTNNSQHCTTPNWRLTLLNRAIRQALPLLIGATCLIIAKPAGANTSVNVRNVIDTTTIVRRFALTSQLERVGTNIGTKVRNQRAPGMGGVNNLNVGDGIIIGQMPRVDNRAIAVDRKLGLPLRDAAGRPLGYCAWDLTSTTPVTDSETGRVLYLPGATGNNEMLTFAVVSAGQNGRLETGCADVLSRFNVNPEANLASGDDLVYASASIEQASSLFASPVDTRIELDALPSAELNEVRFVNDQNAFYVYKGAGPGWTIVSGGFTEQSSGNYVLQGNATVDALTVTGNTTLGDTSADSLTVNATSTFTGRVDIQQLFVNGVEVTGAGSTSASDITSGTLATNFGGTGVDGSLAPAGSLLIGTGAGYTLNTLTAGTGMGVSNGAGTITLSNTGVISITGTADQITASASTGDITLSLPQSISTTSTPTFAGATLNGNLMGTSATFSAGLTSDSLATGAATLTGTLTGTSAIFTGNLDGTTANFTGRVDAQSLFVNGVEVTGGGSVDRTAIDTALTYASDTGSGLSAQANLALGSGALAGQKRAGNVAIGEGVMGQLTTGSAFNGIRNTGVGYQALYSNTSGRDNTAQGYQALYSNTSGYENSAQGTQALYSNTSGRNNSAQGYWALYNNTSGSDNSAQGYQALYNNTTGDRNTAQGFFAMHSNTTGSHNSAQGYYSLFSNTSGSYNSAQGYESLYNNTTGYNNSAQGYLALYNNTTGFYNSAQGERALGNNTTGRANTGLGSDANVLSGGLDYATVVGADSKVSSSNTLVLGALGVNKLGFISTTDDQVVIGATSRDDTTANTKLYVNGAVRINGALVGTSTANFAGGLTGVTANFTGRVDAQSLFVNGVEVTGGGSVTRSGIDTALTTASDTAATAVASMALGLRALDGATRGGNLAIGTDALTNTAVGGFDYQGAMNTALGQEALIANTTGFSNTATGYQAMLGMTSGYQNTGSGWKVLEANTTGHNNVAMGFSALASNTTGAHNTAIGAYANTASSGLNYASAIGGYARVATSDTVVLGALGANKDGVFSTTDDQIVIGATSRDDTTANTKLYVNGAVRINGALVGTSTASFTGNLDGTTANFTGRVDAQSLFVNGVEVTGGGSVDRTAIDTALTYPNESSFISAPNLALGTNALGGSFKSGGNVAIGDSVLHNLDGSNTGYGEANTGVGYQALYSNTRGYNNSAQGYRALYSNTTGFNNSAQGYQALYSNTTGNYNSAQGHRALYSNTTGNYNSAQGYRALYSNTTGSNNSAQGSNALYNNTTGENNSAQGLQALYSNTTGRYNTGLGADADVLSGALNYATVIGAYSKVASSNTLVLGALGVNKPCCVSTTDDQVVIGAASRDDTTANTKLYVNGAVRINGALVGTSTANFAGGLTGTTANFTGRVDAQSLFVNGVEVTGGGSVDRTAIDTALTYASDTGDVNYPESNLALGSGALAGPVRAGNVAIGAGVLGQISISATADNAIQNTGVGYQALYSNATGHRNSAMGYQSLFNNTGGNNNTAMGFHTMYSNSTGSSNVAIGRHALYSNTGGGGNTANGYDALYSNTTGSSNSAVGRDALYSNTTGDDNVAQGRIALYFNTTGSDNVAFGRGALYANTTGNYNTGLGRGADVTSGALNYASAVGGHSKVATSNTLVLGAISAYKDALISTTDDQVVIGATSRDDTTANTKLYVNGAVRINGALVGTSTADFSGGLTGTTANFTGRVDAQSLFVNGVEVTGGGSVDRTAIDTALTYASDTGSGTYNQPNLALGAGALAGQKRAGNVAIGEGVLGQLTTSASDADGTRNTGVGYQALYSNTTGYTNSAQGYQALYSNTSGYENSAQGYRALLNNTTGFGNSAQGYLALYSNTGGYSNSAQGYQALYRNTTGFGNSAQGYQALYSNTTGHTNSAQGHEALFSNTTGFGNSAQGYGALFSNTTGHNNTAIGAWAGTASSGLNYASAIGSYARVATSDTLVLGALNVNKTFFSTTDDQVVIGDTSRTGTHKLYVNGTALATSWNTTSDRRLKTDITVLEGDALLSKLSGVQANRYRYISTPEAGYRIGVIAQDIAGLFPEVASTLGGEFYSVDYNALGAMAAAGVGRLYAKQLEGEQTIATLRTDVDDLQAWQTGVSDRADAIQAALDANLAAIEANTTQLTEQQLRLATAESGIEKATADIAKNLEAIDLNKTSLADNLALINTNKTGIERLDGEIVRFDGITSSNTAAIANNLGLIERNAESIASNLALITVNQQAIAVNTSGIGKLNADVAAITNRVTANEEQIELNVQAIADNLVAITTNANAITRIDEVLLDLTDKTDLQQAAIDNINQRWGNVFDHNLQADTLTIKPGQLVVQNLLADSIQANSIRAQRIEAELAVLAALEVDNLSANVATANNLRAEQLNTGSKELYANAGSLIGLFNAQADGHYTVTVSSSNGQYATATVIVASGVARVVPLQNDGLEILATGTTVQVLGNDQMVKASWTRTG